VAREGYAKRETYFPIPESTACICRMNDRVGHVRVSECVGCRRLRHLYLCRLNDRVGHVRVSEGVQTA
jgi:hypothetical protein